MKSYLIWLVLVAIFTVRFVYTRPIYKDGDTIRITAKVSSQPVRYSDSQYLKLLGLKMYLPTFPEVNYGDKVIIEGVVDKEKSSLKKPTLIEITKTTNWLYVFRSRLVAFYKATLPEPHASLVAGVTVGSKESIPTPFWERLKISGVAHVVVASGMNVTLVGGFLLNLALNFWNRRKALIIALIGIWTYTLICGFEAPLVRASIMGTIAFTAQGYGRINSTVRALFLASLVMLIVNPNWLTDLGFILSFVATLSLILFQVKVDRLIAFVPKIIRTDLATTVAAQIGVAPIIYFVFGQFNIFSPLYNVLVLWTIPIITVIGFFGGMIGLVIPPVGKTILVLAYPFTSFFNMIINL